MVRSMARHRGIPEGEAASLLILNGGAGRKPVARRNGIPLVPKQGVPLTLVEVQAALDDQEA